jgi:hypothetical protein
MCGISEKKEEEKVEKRFHLSITLLLASTRGIQQELCFQAHARLSLEECWVLLRTRDGKMLSCEIRNAKGVLLFHQEEAIERLKPLGMLAWHRTSLPINQSEEKPEQSLISRKNSLFLASMAEPVPVRLTANVDLSTLGHVHRRVLLLVDGHRSVRQIAQLLSKDTEEILAVLSILEDLSLVVF